MASVRSSHLATKGVKALVSIGGWTGSLYYSANVATAENRTAFVKTVVDLATTYNLDGIDFELVISFPHSRCLF